VRTFGLGVLAAGLLLAAGAARAEDEKAAVKEILVKAIKAVGGADKAAKLDAITVKGKAGVSEGGMEVTFTLEGSAKAFDRVRLDVSATINGMTKRAMMVVNGDKAWARDSERDKIEEAPKEIVHLLQTFILAVRSAGNPASLATEKSFTLAPGGEAKVNDSTTVILRLTRKDHPEVSLFYDKTTGYPLKVETRMKEPNGNEEKPYEFHFSDYKDIGGVKHFTRVKVLRDGKDLIEIEFSELKAAEKFEASTFEKP
jgi:hypothetical protein